MGTTVVNGVVNHAGEVFGYRNLFVADGAMGNISTSVLSPRQETYLRLDFQKA